MVSPLIARSFFYYPNFANGYFTGMYTCSEFRHHAVLSFEIVFIPL